MERFGWVEGGRERRGALELALAVGVGVPRRGRGRRVASLGGGQEGG